MDLVLLLLLIVLNALFAMSEMAVVSSRKARLQRMADDGHPGAAAAQRLNDEPSGFLSTIQVGITTIGVLSGMLSGVLSGQQSPSHCIARFTWASTTGRVTRLTFVSLAKN